jgi:hypothetical protein
MFILVWRRISYRFKDRGFMLVWKRILHRLKSRSSYLFGGEFYSGSYLSCTFIKIESSRNIRTRR